MKQELVRTKSKISSLKREMSSIQQLHLAQQQVQAQLSTPTDIPSRQELDKHHHAPSQPLVQRQPFAFTYAAETFTRSNANHHHHHHHHQRQDVSTSSNDESLSPPALSNNSTCTAQSTQTTSRSPPSAILPSTTTSHDSSTQPPTRSSLSVASTPTQNDSSTSPSDEQLRLYLTETIQREKDSAV